MTTDLLPAVRADREPGRTARAVRLALRSWTPRQVLAAIAFTVAFGLLLGLSTVLIPNDVFSREIAVVPWNYPVWVLGSVLAGMLAATYVRPGRATRTPAEGTEPVAALEAGEDRADASSKVGMVGGVLTWFAVGCPVCNKIALLVLGYSGAITWFAPVQPYLAGLAVVLTAGAVVVRLRGQVFCPNPAVRRG